MPHCSKMSSNFVKSVKTCIVYLNMKVVKCEMFLAVKKSFNKCGNRDTT